MSLETAISLEALSKRAMSAFAERYGRKPTVVAAAPGRVNLIGEHTDYNDGFVLPMAIERFTVVAADHATHGKARIFTSASESEITLTPEGEPVGVIKPWGKYVAGVLSVYAEEGFVSPAFDAVIDSSVPLGGGLSSSAALEVSLATAIEALGKYTVSPDQKALYCQRAEHRAGAPCGIMDQFSSALCEADHLMLLDCREQSRSMQLLNDPSVTVLIINSNVKHELTGGEYADRRRQCEEAAAALGVKSLRDANLSHLASSSLKGVHQRRARHVIAEISRTQSAAEAVASSQWEEMGQLMYQSHDSLRDDFEVSCQELDVLVAAARAIGIEGGVYGSRMTGGGFGGCTVTLLRSKNAQLVAERLLDQYQIETGLQGTAFLTRPAQGARLLPSG